MNFFRKTLKRVGILKPKIRSFETSMVAWIDDLMKEEARSGFMVFTEILSSRVALRNIKRELIIAYMYLFTRFSRKHYTSASAHKKGMDQFHIESYKWFVDGADVDFKISKPFEQRLKHRYADYDIAFSQKDGRGTLYMAKTFLAYLDESLDLDADPISLLKCTVSFENFIDSMDETIKSMRVIYPDL